jgi:hypothetical protein
MPKANNLVSTVVKVSRKEYLAELRRIIKEKYDVDFDSFTDEMLIEFLNIDFSTVDWIQ